MMGDNGMDRCAKSPDLFAHYVNHVNTSASTNNHINSSDLEQALYTLCQMSDMICTNMQIGWISEIWVSCTCRCRDNEPDAIIGSGRFESTPPNAANQSNGP